MVAIAKRGNLQSISSIHIGFKFHHIRAFLEIAAALRPRGG
jgi:hypothetical protein